MSWSELHPALNALLNALSGVFLVLGVRAIRNGDREAHKRFLLRAITVSALFLVSYLVRVALTGTHRYPGDGLDKIIYLVILTSHTVLAVICTPFIVRSAYLGLKGRFEMHRKVARLTAPAWLYVSVTGVIVYFMLYHLSRW
ncbi:MAG TPA: DUF420 domain-containing protein [Kofleriaceae bacterium]|nr:DUF420 domain-containing protein [Kofleriaceae bacterium]